MRAQPTVLLDRIFRAGSRYELIPFDRLPEAEREALRQLRDEPGFYGVLQPRADSGAATIKAVNREAALLLFTLQVPGPLPSYVSAEGSGLGARQVQELVLDGVLEVQDGERFVSGPEAAALLGLALKSEPQRKLARLSCEAVRYAEALPIDDPRRLSIRLYLFNRLPLTAAWRSRLTGVERVLGYVGAGQGSEFRARLDRDWAFHLEGEPQDWLSWSLRRSRAERAAFQANFKLYISPSIAALPAVFPEAVSVMAARKVERFKLGADASGLLRPDKMVAYFRSFETLADTAERLAEALRGAEPHGVPFSAEIAGNGLLSWGMDPPAGRAEASWTARASWRAWVADRLASTLIAARSQPSETLPAWRFALERLRLEGVDVEDWTPSAAIWREAAPAHG